MHAHDKIFDVVCLSEEDLLLPEDLRASSWHFDDILSYLLHSNLFLNLEVIRKHTILNSQKRKSKISIVLSDHYKQ